MDNSIVFIVSCEHAGNHIPKKYLGILGSNRAVLDSHEAYDPGALDLARLLARKLGCHIFAGRITRLLINLNRSPHNPRRFSRFTRQLSPEEKHDIELKYYTPYRGALQSEVEQAAGNNKTVVHLCIHSFAPELRGKRRAAQIGLLYDPSRRGERSLCSRLKVYLIERLPGAAVRMNYPYLGIADGFATYLRKEFPSADYIGIELEVNQAFLAEAGVTKKLANILAGFFQTL